MSGNDLLSPVIKHQIKNGEWWVGDCLELMADIPDGSIDMVLCDLPYGVTQNKWDSAIPFKPLWREYWRVCKRSAAVVLTAQCPFDKALGMSQVKYLKYEWIYHKSKSTGHLNAKIMPMRDHENVMIFYREKCTYNPQLTDKPAGYRKPQKSVNSKGSYGSFKEGVYRSIPANKGYPKTVQRFSDPYHTREGGLHPTQKPVALFEYLIKTYTRPGETVLDNTAGSGTTAVAAENTGRRWLCIERDHDYSQKAMNRVYACR